VLRCTGGTDTGDSCLSEAQIATATTVTSPIAMTNGAYAHTGYFFGGAGPDQVDLLKAVVTWVEQGTAPSAQNLLHRKLDANGATTMARPLCASFQRRARAFWVAGAVRPRTDPAAFWADAVRSHGAASPAKRSPRKSSIARSSSGWCWRER
jgi:hypothetical protein